MQTRADSHQGNQGTSGRVTKSEQQHFTSLCKSVNECARLQEERIIRSKIGNSLPHIQFFPLFPEEGHSHFPEMQKFISYF